MQQNTMYKEEQAIEAAYAYDVFFKKHEQSIYIAIHSFIKSRSIALGYDEIDDIFQEVAIKIYKHNYLEKYDVTKSSLRTWLTIICRTVVLDYLRKKNRFADRLENEEQIETADMTTILFQLPANILTQRQQDVLLLSFWADLNAPEIGKHLGISPNTVRSIKHQAIARLRTHAGLQ